MRYTVVWDPKAEDELTELWNESFARRQLTAAADSIDPTLKDDPGLKGARIDDQKRELYIYPLRVLFKVKQQDRQVEVLKIKLDLSAG